MGWQKLSAYNRRALAEADIGDFNSVIRDALRSRTERRRVTEAAVAARVVLPFQIRQRRRSTSATIAAFACILQGLSVGNPPAACAA
jgi:hypothetical protein